MTDTTGSATRTATRSRENTRARLMDAALEVFSEMGLDAASVEAVCERAGFTRGAFYSNFASKDELFLEIIARETETKLERVAERIQGLRVETIKDPVRLVEEALGASFRDTLPPALANELRIRALRDRPTAKAYLAWQDGMIARVEQMITGLVDGYGLRLRMPVAEISRLVVEVGDETITRSSLEGLSDAAATRVLNRRLGALASALIIPPE